MLFLLKPLASSMKAAILKMCLILFLNPHSALTQALSHLNSLTEGLNTCAPIGKLKTILIPGSEVS